MEPNTLLDALLEEAGMSRDGLARRLNTSAAGTGKPSRFNHSSVGRWITGQRPRGQTPALICDVLGQQLGRHLTLEDIGMGNTSGDHATPLAGFVDRATALWRSDRQRPDLTTTPAVTGMAAVAPVWEWENPPEDTDVARTGTPRVGTPDISMLGAARTRYEHMYRQAGGVATRTRIVSFLNEHTAPLLRGQYTDTVGRDLFRAVGGLAAVAGICAYDAAAQGLAQRYFHHALRLAKASGDRRFGGYVIALLVNQSFILGDYRQALAFAEAGLRTAGPHISPALRADLYLTQAKSYARMGSAADAHRCMTAAEQAAAQIRREEEPPETGYVQPGMVELQLAEALAHLDDLTPARAYAEQALGTPTHARGHVQRLATLAKVDLNAGEAGAAAASATEMVDAAAGMESHQLRQRFLELRTRLAAVHTAAAADAVERIDLSLSVPL